MGGLTAAQFDSSAQGAYKGALATVINVDRSAITVSNVRDLARRLSATRSSSRQLSTTGVTFDISIETSDAAAAEVVQTAVTAIKADDTSLKAQVKANFVQASITFQHDLFDQFDVTAVTTAPVTTAKSSGGTDVPVPMIAGAAAAVLVVTAVAVWYQNTRGKFKTQKSNAEAVLYAPPTAQQANREQLGLKNPNGGGGTHLNDAHSVI